MSKTHEIVIKSFLEDTKRKISNTETNGRNLYLFGNRIAWRDEHTNELWISTCGWNSVTTRDRLNMLPDVWVRTFKGQLLLYVGHSSTQQVSDWIKWDGKPINITELMKKSFNN